MKIGVVAVFVGCVGIMALRVLTLDLTEGQALTHYWWGWAICLALVVGGAIITKKESN